MADYEDVGLRAKIEGIGKYKTDAKAVTDSMNKISKSATATAKNANKFGTAITGMVKPMLAVTAAMAGAFATKAITEGISDMVQMASDLNESINKVSVVFGEASEAVLDWSKTTATAIGQSRQEALEAVGTFGNLFKTMGLGQDEAAQMSMNIAELASDLASFNNIDPTIALDKLRSGLVGEVEPLRQVGILLNETVVANKAMEMGLAKSKKELSESAKVQARYALILEQSVDAQGDFARTSGDMANASRIISANMKDLQAVIGEALLPVVAELTTTLAEELPRAIERATPALQRLASWMETVADRIGDVIEAFDKLSEVTNRYRTTLNVMADAMGPAGWFIKGLLAISEPIELKLDTTDFLYEGKRALDELDLYSDRLVYNMNRKFAEVQPPLTGPSPSDTRSWLLAQRQLDEFRESAIRVGESGSSAMYNVSSAVDYLRGRINDLEMALMNAQAAMRGFADPRLTGMQAAEDELFELDMAIKRARLEELGLGHESVKAAEKVKQAAEDMSDGFDLLAAQQRELAQGIPVALQRYRYDLEQAQRAAEIEEPEREPYDGIAATPAQEESEVDRLRRLREAKQLMYDLTYQPLLRQLRETFEDLTGANKEITFEEAMIGLQRSWEESQRLTKEISEQKQILENQETSMVNLNRVSQQLTAEEARRLEIQKEIYNETEELLQMELERLDALARYNALAKKTLVRTPTEWEEWGEPGMQTGGRVIRGGLVKVGEAGPELASLPTGTTVMPNAAIPAQVSRSYSDTWNITQANQPVDVVNEIRKYNAFRRILVGR